MANSTRPTPPSWITSLVNWYSSSFYKDEILGDMQEAFERRIKKYGLIWSQCLYLWDALRFCRPYIISGPGTNRHHSRSNWTDMLKSYITIGYRNLLRNKVFTLVNVTGLSIGITCFIFISLYIQHEISYDQFLEDQDYIYRVALHHRSPKLQQDYAVTHIMLGPTLEETYPEVMSSTRLHKLYFHPEVTILAGDKSFAETKLFLADNQFFDMFPMEFIEGGPVDALATERHVVLTEKIARKYFGDEPAFGKLLKLDFGREMVVSGVIKNLPQNSHMDFELLGSLKFMNYLKSFMENPNWAMAQVCTYIKLQPGLDQSLFEDKLPTLVESQGRKQIDTRYGEGVDYRLTLQPVTDIHLHSNMDAEMTTNGSIVYIYMLIILAVFVLAISCINFINLSTARSAERAKEVGIRKVMGSSRRSLLVQFLTESVLVSMLSMIIGLAIVVLMLPYFNLLVDKTFSLAFLQEPIVILTLTLFSILLGAIAGLYPAMVISSMKTTGALKGKLNSSKSGVVLRNGLIVFQYFISVGLIAATLIIDQQLRYVSEKNLGFDTEEVLLIKHPLSIGQSDPVEQGNFPRMSLAILDHSNKKIEVFKKELKNILGVVEAGGTFQNMGNRFSLTEFKPVNEDEQLFSAHFQNMDDGFAPAVGIDIIQGRAFSPDFNDSTSALINETLQRQLGWEDPIGKKFNFKAGDPTTFTIVGIVKDYHYQSLHEKIGSLVILSGETMGSYFPTVLAVRVKSKDIGSVISQIEATWNEFVPEESLNLAFLDQDLNRLYETDRSSRKIFNLFSIIAILLACVGLFGLAAYVTQQKNKEIGVRKVLGASVPGLVLLLSKSFIKLIMIAFVITVPITFYGIDQWLENFAYRVDVGVMPFVLALIIALFLAFITISHQTLKAALINPVESLKSE